MNQLSIIDRETWQREFVIQRNNLLLGDNSWEAEFTLMDLSDPSSPIFSCSVANGRCAWLGNGVVRVTIPQSSLRTIEAEQLGFMLRVIDPSAVDEDPNGKSWICIRGLLQIERAFTPEPTGMRTY